MPFVRDRRPGDARRVGLDDQQLVDVGTIVGVDGQPVPRNLCGPPEEPRRRPHAAAAPARSRGAIALVSRGTCTFALKAARVKAAGATGLVLVDNRSGEANGIPIQLAVPGGMIADVDGAALRALPRPATADGHGPDRPQAGGARHRPRRSRHQLLVRRA